MVFDPLFTESLEDTESSGNPLAISPKGAKGLRQIMDATFKEFADPGDDPFDPEDSRKVSDRYLQYLSDRFDSPELVLAAYNGGPGYIKKLQKEYGPDFDNIRPHLYDETRNYVDSVLGKYDAKRGVKREPEPTSWFDEQDREEAEKEALLPKASAYKSQPKSEQLLNEVLQDYPLPDLNQYGSDKKGYSEAALKVLSDPAFEKLPFQNQLQTMNKLIKGKNWDDDVYDYAKGGNNALWDGAPADQKPDIASLVGTPPLVGPDENAEEVVNAWRYEADQQLQRDGIFPGIFGNRLDKYLEEAGQAEIDAHYVRNRGIISSLGSTPANWVRDTLKGAVRNVTDTAAGAVRLTSGLTGDTGKRYADMIEQIPDVFGKPANDYLYATDEQGRVKYNDDGTPITKWQSEIAQGVGQIAGLLTGGVYLKSLGATNKLLGGTAFSIDALSQANYSFKSVLEDTGDISKAYKASAFSLPAAMIGSVAELSAISKIANPAVPYLSQFNKRKYIANVLARSAPLGAISNLGFDLTAQVGETLQTGNQIDYTRLKQAGISGALAFGAVSGLHALGVTPLPDPKKVKDWDGTVYDGSLYPVLLSNPNYLPVTRPGDPEVLPPEGARPAQPQRLLPAPADRKLLPAPPMRYGIEGQVRLALPDPGTRTSPDADPNVNVPAVVSDAELKAVTKRWQDFQESTASEMVLSPEEIRNTPTEFFELFEATPSEEGQKVRVRKIEDYVQRDSEDLVEVESIVDTLVKELKRKPGPSQAPQLFAKFISYQRNFNLLEKDLTADAIEVTKEASQLRAEIALKQKRVDEATGSEKKLAQQDLRESEEALDKLRIDAGLERRTQAVAEAEEAARALLTRTRDLEGARTPTQIMERAMALQEAIDNISPDARDIITSTYLNNLKARERNLMNLLKKRKALRSEAAIKRRKLLKEENAAIDLQRKAILGKLGFGEDSPIDPSEGVAIEGGYSAIPYNDKWYVVNPDGEIVGRGHNYMADAVEAIDSDISDNRERGFITRIEVAPSKTALTKKDEIYLRREAKKEAKAQAKEDKAARARNQEASERAYADTQIPPQDLQARIKNNEASLREYQKALSEDAYKQFQEGQDRPKKLEFEQKKRLREEIKELKKRVAADKALQAKRQAKIDKRKADYGDNLDIEEARRRVAKEPSIEEEVVQEEEKALRDELEKERAKNEKLKGKEKKGKKGKSKRSDETLNSAETAAQEEAQGEPMSEKLESTLRPGRFNRTRRKVSARYRPVSAAFSSRIYFNQDNPEVVRPQEIQKSAQKLVSSLNKHLKIFYGGRIEPGVLGFLDPLKTYIKVGRYDDVSTLLHEMTHAVDQAVIGMWSQQNPAGDYSHLPKKVRDALAETAHTFYHPARLAQRPHIVPMEGLTKFFEHYATGQEVHRDLVDWYHNQFSKESPDVYKAMEEIRDLSLRYFNQTPGAYQKSRIIPKPGKIERLRNYVTTNRFRDNWVDIATVLTQADQAGKTGGAFKALYDANKGRARALAKQLTNVGLVDLGNNQIAGPSLRAILEPVKGNLEEFQAYLTSLRDLAYIKAGLDPGGNIKDSARAIAEFESLPNGLGSKMKQAADDYYNYNLHVLDMVAAASDEGAFISAKIKQENLRVTGKEHGYYVPFSRSAKGSFPLATRKGSAKPIIDPLTNIENATQAMLEKALASQLKEKMLEVGGDRGGNVSSIGAYIREVTGGERIGALKEYKERVKSVTDKNATIDDMVLGAFGGDPLKGISSTEHSVLPVLDGNDVRFIEVDNRIANLFSDTLPEMVNSWWYKAIFRGPAMVFRPMATTFRIPFQLKQMIRDPLSAYRYVQTGQGGWKDALYLSRAIIDSVMDVSMHSAGGNPHGWTALVSRLGLDFATSLGSIQEVRAAAQKQYGKSLLDLGNATFDKIENFLSTPERSVRQAAMRLEARRLGITDPNQPLTPQQQIELILAYKRSTTNFQVQGKAGRVVNLSTPFFTARIAELSRLPGDIKRNPTRMAVLGSSMLGLGLMHSLAHNDEEWYQELTPKAKATSAWFKIDVGGVEKIAFIPLDSWSQFTFGLGQMAGTKMGEDPTLPVSYKELASAYFGSHAPVQTTQLGPIPVPIDLAGPLIKEGFQLYSNRDIYFERDIVPAGLKYADPRVQYTEFTSELAKSVGALIGESPILIDHAIRNTAPAVTDMLYFADNLSGAKQAKEYQGLNFVFKAFTKAGTAAGQMDRSQQLFQDKLMDFRQNKILETPEQEVMRKSLERINKSVSELNTVIYGIDDQKLKDKLRVKKRDLLQQGLRIGLGAKETPKPSGVKQQAEVIRKGKTDRQAKELKERLARYKLSEDEGD